MEKYTKPTVEVIELDESNVVTYSNYECPENYGSTCTANPYGGM